MRHTALLLALLLSFSLTACSMRKTDTDKKDKNNTPSVTTPDKDRTEDKNDDTIIDKDNDKKDDDTVVDDKKDDPAVDTPVVPDDTAEGRSFMYAGKLYNVKDEKVAQEKVGAELFSITAMSDEAPANDGEGMGLDEGVRVFKFVEENEYRELAVEIDGEYLLAVLAENDDTVPDTEKPDMDMKK